MSLISPNKYLKQDSVSDAETDSSQLSQEDAAGNLTRQVKLNMELVLENPMLVQKIMKNCCLHELKLCRLFNPTWKFMATDSIQKRNICSIRIVWNCRTNSFENYRHTGFNTDKVMTLGQLNQVLRGSVDFPCTSFAFHSLERCFSSNPEFEAVQNFFEIQGSKVKSLDLSLEIQNRDHNLEIGALLHNILMKQAPFIEKLSLCGFHCKVEEFKLPALKIFQWTNTDSQVYHKILKGAPNLKVSGSFNLEDDLSIFLEFGKIDTLKKLSCTDYEKPELLDVFSNSAPKLESLEFKIFDNVSQSLSTVFNNLLAANSNTLKILSLGDLCHFGKKTQIPVLKYLNILKLKSNDRRRCFPAGIKFRETFPNVQILDCSGLVPLSTLGPVGGSNEVNDWDGFFPMSYASGQLRSVVTLKIDYCTEFWLRGLNDLCPNFKKLIITGEQLQTKLATIFKLWSHLESLQVEIGGGIRIGGGEEPTGSNLDPAFTGFSRATCDSLLVKVKEEGSIPVEQVMAYKVAPSISNLKRLKVLKIVYPKNTEGVVSRLSCIYGFNLIPDLRVSILLKHKCYRMAEINSIADELSPYVGLHYEVKDD